jgi:hypothetical protein
MPPEYDNVPPREALLAFRRPGLTWVLVIYIFLIYIRQP